MANTSLNKVQIIGNLGADPETRYTAGGTPVANAKVATSESWRDKSSGEMRERTEWHRLVFFAALADTARDYLRKGSKIYVEGRNQTRKWQGSDGVDRYTTEIVVNELKMLDGRGRSEPSQAPQPASTSEPDKCASPPPNEGQRRPPSAPSAGAGQPARDDVPFQRVDWRTA